MDEDLTEIEEAFATTLAHTTMITALFSLLQEKGVLSQNDINSLMDTAITGAENAIQNGASPRLMNRTRQILEQSARNLGGPRRRRS
jgi:hypothetical protein